MLKPKILVYVLCDEERTGWINPELVLNPYIRRPTLNGQKRSSRKMYNAKCHTKCRVVKKVTEQNTFRCLKPATVILILNTPEPLVMCQDCASALAKEIAESVPGGRRDVAGKGARNE